MNTFLYNYAEEIHKQNVDGGWWPEDKATRERTLVMMLCISELSEGAHGIDNDLFDDHLPQFKMVDVEIADCFIRSADLSGCDVIPYLSDGLICDDNGVPVITPEWTITGNYNSMFTTYVNYMSAALEGYRKNGKMHIYRANIKKAYEFIFEFGVAYLGFQKFVQIVEAKREYNRNRADHKIENRSKEGGKRF